MKYMRAHAKSMKDLSQSVASADSAELRLFGNYLYNHCYFSHFGRTMDSDISHPCVVEQVGI